MPNTNQFRLPAEWEPQDAVMLTWPHAATDWNDCLEAISQTYVQMAHAISRQERLLIVTPHAEEVKALLGQRLTAAQMANIGFHECPTNDTWARDHGFISLTDGQGSARLLDFCFNGWGCKFEAALDNRINRSIFDAGWLNGHYCDCLDFVLEGGSIESDGRGTVFTTSQCLMAPHRNEPLGRHEVELRLKETLQADRIVWLDHGNLVGDDTDGHIDTIVRVAPGDTLVYVGCDNRHDEQWADFKALEQQLEELKTADGQPYRLLRLPMPDAICDDDGNRLPATYANFLVMNRCVLVPVYGQTRNDEAALRIIGEAFPDRELEAIDSRTIILQHGSLHCCTMQLPQGVLRTPKDTNTEK